MTSPKMWPCGCIRRVGHHTSGDFEMVQPCDHHRCHPKVQAAFQAMSTAVNDAHADLPPLQIEQEERAASGERYR